MFPRHAAGHLSDFRSYTAIADFMPLNCETTEPNLTEPSRITGTESVFWIGTRPDAVFDRACL